MIRIELEKYGSKCNNCGGIDDVKAVNVGMASSNTYGGFCLCNKCRRDLSRIIRRDMGLADIDDVARGVVACRRGACSACPYTGYEAGTCENNLKDDLYKLFVEG